MKTLGSDEKRSITSKKASIYSTIWIEDKESSLQMQTRLTPSLIVTNGNIP